MIVKTQKPIKFINTCDCIVHYEELEQAILWYQDKPTARLKKIYLYGRYPAVSIHDKKVHIHRLLMMYWLDNKNLPKNIHVHHENAHILDCTKSNLKCYFEPEHLSFHNAGKTITSEHRLKISIAGRRRKGMRIKKRLNIPIEKIKQFLEQGKSINYIAKHFNCDWTTIKSRIHQNPELIEEKQ